LHYYILTKRALAYTQVVNSTPNANFLDNGYHKLVSSKSFVDWRVALQDRYLAKARRLCRANSACARWIIRSRCRMYVKTKAAGVAPWDALYGRA